MKTRKNLLTLFTVLMILSTMTIQLNSAERKVVFTDLYGDYFGQTPPGDTPVVFAPGFISRKSLEHGPAIFSTDGNEVYWCSRKSAREWQKTNLWFMKRINNRWTKPQKLAPFGVEVGWMDPFLSKDGKRLYFSADSNTIKEKGMSASENRDIWFIEKQNEGWSKPQKISPVIDTIHGQSQPTLTRDGTVYFLEYKGEGKKWRCDIFKSKLKNGNYLPPIALPASINLPVKQASLDWTPYIAPDDSYLIFSSTRERKYGDLYISFHDISNDTWSVPIGMGEAINTKTQESYPTVSPDGKYLFFTRYNYNNKSMDVFWVSAGIIKKLKTKAMLEDRLKQQKKEEIHKVADAGNLNKVRALIEADSTLLEARNKNYNTPLITACLAKQVAVANFLIDKGANVKAVGRWQYAVLTWASDVPGQDTVLLQRLIDKGADVNTQSRSRSRTALHRAAYRGGSEVAKLLLDNGAEVNVQAYNGVTPLHRAAQVGNLKVAKLLIDKGADVNINDKYTGPVEAWDISGSVLKVAINLSPNEEMAMLIVESDAKLNNKDNNGNTALHQATLKGYDRLVGLLVKHGADLNALNKYNRTPLYYAAKHGYRTVADVLIAAGADKSTIVEANYGKAQQLTEKLKEGEAYLWYLNGGMYVVKTKENLLVFTIGAKIKTSPEAGLANGFLNPKELAGQKITMLINHMDRWQMSGKRFAKSAKLSTNANMVSGFKPDFSKEKNLDIPAYHLAIPNESFSLDGLKVHPIKALAHGMGYLIEVDGLKIFHAGFHISDDKPEHIKKFRKEIDFLKTFGPIDIVMMTVVSHSNNVGMDYANYIYLLEQLAPKTIYLFGANIPETYTECADVLRKCKIPVVYPKEGRGTGERFHYLRDRVKK